MSTGLHVVSVVALAIGLTPFAPGPLLMPHPSIAIHGDAGFEGLLSGVVSGSGSATDPFVIRGWEIVHTGQAGILLHGTSAHVVIEDVSIRTVTGRATAPPSCVPDIEASCNLPVGIRLLDAKNVVLHRVRVDEAFFGVVAERVEDVQVRESRFSTSLSADLVEVAVLFRDAARVTVEDTTFEDVFAGVVARRSSEVRVADSTFTRAWGAAVFLGERTEDATLVGNRFLGTSVLVDGVHDGLRVVDNAFEGARATFRTSYGIEVPTRVTAPLICGNAFTGGRHSDAVLWLQRTVDAQVVGNRFTDVDRGVRIDFSTRGTVQSNVFTNTSVRGALMFSDGGWRIEDNAFEATPVGLGTSSTRPGTATHNWWGHPSGPGGIGPGVGAAILSNGSVPHDPWLLAPPPPATSCPAGGP